MKDKFLAGYGPAWLVIALAVIGWTIVGSNYHFIPCHTDCGETFVAEAQARNAELFGMPFALIEDHATSPDLAAHPYSYTHNVNIAGVLFPVMQLMGIDSVAAKQVVTLLAFAFGLFFLFKVVEEQSRSKALALVVLILFCTEYRHVLTWGLAALRAWHWLGLFGTLYYALRLIQDQAQGRLRNLGMLLLMLSISFGIGYEFFALTLAVCGFALLFAKGFKAILPIFVLAGLSTVPFLLRQIQVASVMGSDYWLKDFQYSILIKVPGAARIFGMPPMEQIEQFYVQENVLRPYATPAQSIAELVTYTLQILKDWTLPTTGVVAFALMLIVFTGAWALFLARGGQVSARYVMQMFPGLIPKVANRRVLGFAVVLIGGLGLLIVGRLLAYAGVQNFILLTLVLMWLALLGYALSRMGFGPAAKLGAQCNWRSISAWGRDDGLLLGLLGVVSALPAIGLVYMYFRPAVGWREFLSGAIPTGAVGVLVGLGIGAIGLAGAIGLINIVRNNGWAHPQNAEDQANRQSTIRLLTALSLGIIVGMGIFMPLSIIFYMKHQFPLLAAPLLIAKGLVIWYFASKCIEARNTFVRIAAGVLVILFVGDHIAVQINNYNNRREMDVSWIPEVAKRKNDTFAVSWIAPSVSAFTNNWVMGVIPGRQDQILQRLQNGESPFIEQDMFYFGEKDKNERLEEYLRPDYWLYFRIYYDAGFDCRKYDPVSALFRSGYRRFVSPYGVPQVAGRSGVLGSKERGPGSWGRLQGSLQSNAEAVERIDALQGFFVASSMADGDVLAQAKGMSENRVLAQGSFNCQTKGFSVNWQVPKTVSVPTHEEAQDYILPIRVSYRDGRAFIVDFVRVSVGPDYPVFGPPGVHDQLPQVEEIVREYPDLNIVARGPEYFLVDMRGHYRKAKQ